MKRELLFRLTKKDFEVTHIFGSGSGGQHRNKNATGVRIKHSASGAQGVATDSKSQATNKKAAFSRLVASPAFKQWHRMECARLTLDENQIRKQVDKWVQPENLKIEYYTPVK